MANWSGFNLTDVGADLQAKINAGLTTLKFTKVGVGSGSGSVNALTAMVHKEQDIGIGNVEANGNIVTINFTLTNKGLNAAYKMRELGLFATDPDVGEILFAYMTDSSPDTMPADGSATVVGLDVTLNITFSNTGNVSATIDTGAFVTQEDLEAHEKSITAHSALMTKHNTDTTAHQPIIDLINNNQTALNSKIELHNSDKHAHADIINTHNADVNAHTPILNAIKAITGMSAYNTAPSKTIAAMIPLLGFGGIVAQNLNDNGYIKFANGLTLQFGLTGDIPKNGTYLVNYPIAFTLLLYAGGFATINGDAGNTDEIKMYNLPNQYNMTLLNTADNYTARTYWLAIGLI